jgi:hypothetical protein
MARRVFTCDQDYRNELTDALEAFDARVRAAQAAAAWTAPSPCEGWTAADVVRHVTGNVYAFVNTVGGEGTGGAQRRRPAERPERSAPPGANTEADAEHTTVTLPDASQNTLQGFLGQLRSHGIPLVSVTQAQPDLEEVFIRLLRSASSGNGGAAATAAAGEPVG